MQYNFMEIRGGGNSPVSKSGYFQNRFVVSLFFCALILVIALPARAACTNPAGEKGVMVYNVDYNVMQFCNGTEWVAMAGLAPAAGGTPTVQFTSATYDGNLGGVDGANTKCQAEYPGSYFCHIGKFMEVGDTSGAVGWVYNFSGGTDCWDWVSGSATPQGAKTPSGTPSACNNFYPIACCSQ